MNAVLTAPTNGAGARAGVTPAAPLWGELEIPLIVGTGDYGSGKTIFGLTICPGPETLVYDNEGSSLIYRSIGFHHVDMAAELRKEYGEKFTAQQRYTWWKSHAIDRLKTGKYRVLMVDPASELEDGLTEYIKTHVSEFGLTAEQVQKSGGILWGTMKSEWKKTLDLFRTYCETTYLTVHLRQKFIGNKPDPAGTLEPKGKETLYELSSLFLWFEKSEKSAVPTAKVEKSRLSKFAMINDEFTPIAVLPPNLPRATPKAIRDYIATPPDYSKLKAGEKVREHVMSEDERLRLQATIATANAEASQNEYNRLAMMQQNAAAQAAKTAATVPTPDQSAAHAQAHAEKAAANIRPPVSQAQIASIVALLAELFGAPNSPAANEWLAPRIQAMGVSKPTEMTDAQGDGLHSELLGLRAEQQQARLAERSKELMATSVVGSSPPPASLEPPFDPTPAAKYDVTQDGDEDESQTPPAVASAAQKEEANHLIPLAFPDPSVRGAKLPALCLKHGSANPKDLTYEQMESLLAELRQLSTTRMVPTPPAARPELIAKLREHCEKTGWSRDKQQEWLQKAGLQNFTQASDQQISDLIEMLITIETSFKGGMPGNS